MTQAQLDRYHELLTAKTHSREDGEEYQALAALYRLHEPHRGHSGYRVDYRPEDLVKPSPVQKEGVPMAQLTGSARLKFMGGFN